MSIASVRPYPTARHGADQLALSQVIVYVAASVLTRKVYVTVELPGEPSVVYSGDVNSDITLLDVHRDSHVTGTYAGGTVKLLDERTGQRAEFTLTGNTFRGVMGPAGTGFHGSVERDRVFLFDDARKSRQVFTVRGERTNARQPMIRPPLAKLS